MKRLAVCVAAALLTAAGATAAKKPVAEPVVWGVTSQNTGCVIFEEGHKYTGPMGIAGKTPVLRVVGTLDYALDTREWLETPENLDALNARAEKDRVKLIKIPEKHSQELMRRARALCRADQ